MKTFAIIMILAGLLVTLAAAAQDCSAARGQQNTRDSKRHINGMNSKDKLELEQENRALRENGSYQQDTQSQQQNGQQEEPSRGETIYEYQGPPSGRTPEPQPSKSQPDWSRQEEYNR